MLEDISLASYMMFFIDVEFLFTKVPLHETVDFLCEFISSSNISSLIPSDYLRELNTLCTRKIQPHFDVVAMGSPLGRTRADAFLSMMEMKLNDCISKLVLYKILVEITLIFTDSDSFVNTLKFFNSAHPTLSVSYEEEAND